MRVILGHEAGRLWMELPDMPVQDFLRTPLWKVRLAAAKSKRPEVEGNRLVFSRDVGMRDCQAILDSLRAARAHGVELEVDPSFESAVSAEASHLEERAQAGLAIKARDASVAEKFAEFSRVVDQNMVRSLRDRQMWDAFFMCVVGRSANFSVPGSGKTASVLGTYAYLHAHGDVDRIVVISPKNAFGSWRDEWAACFGELEPCRSLCFHDRQWVGSTRTSRRSEIGLSYKRYNLILLNYESANYGRPLFDAVADRSLLVFDEVHKVKRVGGKRAKDALEVARHARFAIALTGTPIPNSYLDVYNLLHILYPADYDWYFGFRENVLKNPDQSVIDKVNESIQPFFCRTNKRMLGVPEASPDHIVPVLATWVEHAMLNVARNSLESDPLALIIRVLQLESDPSMLLDAIPEADLEWLSDSEDVAPRLRSGSFDPVELPGSLREEVAHAGPSSKTSTCVELVDDLCSEGKSVIVWCIFRQSIDNLTRAFTRLGYSARAICGDVDMEERREILDGFKAGDVQVLVTNPHTLAESVSLHMACHDAVYFECSYNLVHLLQSKDRINRLGLPEGQYTQYHFLQEIFPSRSEDGWSLDRNIYERLAEKEETMLTAIDRGVLEPGATDKRDLELIFRGLFDEGDATSPRGSDAGEPEGPASGE